MRFRGMEMILILELESLTLVCHQTTRIPVLFGLLPLVTREGGV